MERITVSKLKSDLSEIIKKVKGGIGFEIISEGEQVIGYFLPPSQSAKPKRKLGILAGTEVKFASDFKMSEEEFLGWENE